MKVRAKEPEKNTRIRRHPFPFLGISGTSDIYGKPDKRKGEEPERPEPKRRSWAWREHRGPVR